MNIENVIKLFLEEKIKVKEVDEMFEKGELTLENIDKYEFHNMIKKLKDKYNQVVGLSWSGLPFDFTMQETIICLMIAIEEKVSMDEVIEGTRSELPDDCLI